MNDQDQTKTESGGAVASSDLLDEINCPSCYGTGEWETECCNGAGGCSCRGQVVPMGRCNVCNGSGKVPANVTPEQLKANCRAIAGLHFIGSGSRDTHSIWPNRGNFV